MTDPDNRPDPAELLSGLLQGTEDRTDRVEGGLDASNKVTEAIVNNIRPVAMSDPVQHPAHYTWLGGIEVIDITEHLGFCLGNVVKYVLRADHKGKPIEDLEKARWYIERELQRRKKGEKA